MSIFVPIESACGRKVSSIDIFDLDLNPFGFECCSECRVIIESREAWMDEDGDYIPAFQRLSCVPDNDPFYV